MRDLRRAGLLLLLTALLVVSFLARASPLPESHEQWSCCGDDGGPLMVARGPAIARYDPQEDVTYAVFQCAHGYCGFATRLEGDVRERVESVSVLLRSGYSHPSRAEAPMPEPIPVPATLAPAAQVANATTYTFQVVSPWPPMLALGAALGAAVVGAILAWGVPRDAAVGAAAGAAAGLVLALMLLRALAPDLQMLAPLPPLLLVAAGAVAAWLRRPSLAATLVACGAQAFLAAAWLDAFFVHPPTR